MYSIPDHVNKSGRVFYSTGSGEEHGFMFFVNTEPEHYISSISKMPGTSIFIQNPDEYVGRPTQVFHIPTQYLLNVHLIPEILMADESIRHLSPSKRGCAFDEDNSLEFTQKYSYNQCLSECRFKVILKECKCIPFHFPHRGLLLPTKIKTHMLIFNCFFFFLRSGFI